MRFIEHMPLDGGHTWRREEMVTADEILAAVSERFSLEALGHDGAATALALAFAVVHLTSCSPSGRLRLFGDSSWLGCAQVGLRPKVLKDQAASATDALVNLGHPRQ